MIRLPESAGYEEVSLEKRCRAATRALAARIGALYRRARDEFGDDALELIRSVSSAHGRDLADDLCPTPDRHDAESAGLCLAQLLDLLGIEGEVIEISPDRCRIRIDECPYGISQPDLCEARTALESEFIRRLAGDLTLQVERCLARGDGSCLLKIEKTG